MFSKEDYTSYLNEVQEVLKKTIVIYTDLINQLGNQAMQNKLYVLAEENMELFKFIESQKEKFS